MPIQKSRTSITTIEPCDGFERLDPNAVVRALEVDGTVLLRGFMADLNGFEAFTRLFCHGFHRSVARDELRALRGDGFTARTPPVNFTLLAHSEGSYLPFKPADLGFFLCREPPSSTGGETVLVDGRLFLDRLPGELRQRFESRGVIFEAQWETERWTAELDVSHESDLAALTSRFPDLELRLEGNCLQYRCRRSAIQADHGGQPVFCNAILAHLPVVRHPGYGESRVWARETNKVYFGDGEALSDAVVDLLIDIQDSVALEHEQRRHDLLIIDNTRVMHGRRRTANDCPRELLTRFGYRDRDATAG